MTDKHQHIWYKYPPKWWCRDCKGEYSTNIPSHFFNDDIPRSTIKAMLDEELERWKNADRKNNRYHHGRLSAAKHFSSRLGFYDFGAEKEDWVNKFTPPS